MTKQEAVEMAIRAAERILPIRRGLKPTMDTWPDELISLAKAWLKSPSAEIEKACYDLSDVFGDEGELILKHPHEGYMHEYHVSEVFYYLACAVESKDAADEYASDCVECSTKVKPLEEGETI